MNELMMIEAALFQLRASVGDDPQMMPVRLSADVLANAVAAAKATGLNPARANDIEFALNDLVSAIDDTGAGEEAQAIVAMLRRDAESIRAAGQLAPEIVAQIRELQRRLKERAAAIERAQYRAEGTEAAPLPHPPEELRAAAIPLARQLAALGFDTPALDVVVADPESLRFHSIHEVINELDAVAP
jgi:hypothetical protein